MRSFPVVLLTFALFSIPPAMALSYEDATTDSGFYHKVAGEIHDPDSRSADWPGFPEIFGPGACFADFDGDVDQDLYLVNQRYNPENPQYGAWAAEEDPRDRLWRNEGFGTFVDVTDQAGIDGRGFGYGCSAADYDGDGDLDLYVTDFGDNQLLRNDGGMRFSDVTTAAGIQDALQCRDQPCASMGSAWGDYDRDGDLDLYVTNYVDTALDDQQRGPENHIAQENQLLRNNGDGTFTDVAREAGVEGDAKDAPWGSKSFQPMWTDTDLDGDLDLYVTNDLTPNDYYVNNGDGSFTDRSNESGLADTRQGMGLTTGDYNGDCYPDFFFTHYSGVLNGLYLNNRDGTWQDEGDEGGMGEALDWVGWGAHFLDVDLDMDEDLIVVNGHTEWIMDNIRPEIGYAHPIQLFLNVPDTDGSAASGRSWVAATNETAGPSIGAEWVGRGIAVADLAFDGVGDFVLTPNGNQTASFHRGTGVENPWLRVELAGLGMNRHGVGAKVWVEAGGVRQCREVFAGSGFLGQNEMALTFGLGDGLQADRVEIRWPDGHLTAFEDVPAPNAIRVFRATDTYIDDTLPPITRVVGDSEGHDGWWNRSVTARLETVDRGVSRISGVATVEHHLGDGDWAAYAGDAYTFTDEGLDFIHARSTDKAGNAEPETPLRVGRDFTPPLPTHKIIGIPGDDGWLVRRPAGFELGGVDLLSGVGQIRYRIDEGPWQTYHDDVQMPYEGGVYVITYRVWDVAMNAADPVSFVIRHDPVPPTVAVVRPETQAVYLGDVHVASSEKAPDWALLLAPPAEIAGLRPSFSVNAVAEDPLSGVRWVALARDGVEVQNVSGPLLSWHWDTRVESLGHHSLVATARDVAGNEAEATRVTQLAHAPVGPSDDVSAGAGPGPWSALPFLFAGLGIAGGASRGLRRP